MRARTKSQISHIAMFDDWRWKSGHVKKTRNGAKSRKYSKTQITRAERRDVKAELMAA